MSSRFLRHYTVKIRPPQGAEIVAAPPLRIVFTCTKSISGGLNQLSIQIYGLNETNRLSIVKDADEQKRIQIILEAGYEGNVDVIFQGTVHTCSNDRQGADFVSSIEALDGGENFLRTYIASTVADKNAALNAIIDALDDVTLGASADLPDILRPRVLVGRPDEIIKSIIGPNQTAYVDNEQLFILDGDQVVSEFVPLVTAQSGLLKTPKRSAQKISFDTLLNPSLRIGARCVIESVNAPYLNGAIRIESITTTGDSDGSDWRQNVTGLAMAEVKRV